MRGCESKFYLGSNIVAELDNLSNPFTKDMLEVTSFDSSCMKKFLPGLGSSTMDISGFFDPTDTTGQVALQTAAYAGTLLTSTQLPKILWDTTHGISANAYVTSLTIGAAVAGIVTFSATLQLTGTVTVVTP